MRSTHVVTVVCNCSVERNVRGADVMVFCQEKHKLTIHVWSDGSSPTVEGNLGYCEEGEHEMSDADDDRIIAAAIKEASK